jgi:hypothetical protein
MVSGTLSGRSATPIGCHRKDERAGIPVGQVEIAMRNGRWRYVGQSRNRLGALSPCVADVRA